MESLKNKLAYEWKNIYRYISSKDTGGAGKISQREFEQAVHKNGAFLTREDTDLIKKYFSTPSGEIEYGRLSKDLGMQTNSLSLVT